MPEHYTNPLPKYWGALRGRLGGAPGAKFQARPGHARGDGRARYGGARNAAPGAYAA